MDNLIADLSGPPPGKEKITRKQKKKEPPQKAPTTQKLIRIGSAEGLPKKESASGIEAGNLAEGPKRGKKEGKKRQEIQKKKNKNGGGR